MFYLYPCQYIIHSNEFWSTYSSYGDADLYIGCNADLNKLCFRFKDGSTTKWAMTSSYTDFYPFVKLSSTNANFNNKILYMTNEVYNGRGVFNNNNISIWRDQSGNLTLTQNGYVGKLPYKYWSYETSSYIYRNGNTQFFQSPKWLSGIGQTEVLSSLLSTTTYNVSATLCWNIWTNPNQSTSPIGTYTNENSLSTMFFGTPRWIESVYTTTNVDNVETTDVTTSYVYKDAVTGRYPTYDDGNYAMRTDFKSYISGSYYDEFFKNSVTGVPYPSTNYTFNKFHRYWDDISGKYVIDELTSSYVTWTFDSLTDYTTTNRPSGTYYFGQIETWT